MPYKLVVCKKEHHRKGIARALVNEARRFYKANNLEISEMTVNSSPYAVEAYHRLGVSDTDVEQTINGIRFTPMKCTL